MRVRILAGEHGREVALVAEVVLRDRARPEGVVQEDGRAGDAEERAEVGLDEREEFVGGQAGESGLARAADHHDERDVSGGRAAGEERGGEEHAEQAAAFLFGNEEAEAVEGVRDLFAAVAEEK